MWKEIAKKLGVELDELFDIVNIEGQIIAKNVYIDQFGMNTYATDGSESYLEARLICHVLDKESGYAIKKRPYIPKYHDRFYSIENYDPSADIVEAKDYIWIDSLYQRCLLATGNVFKTAEEAQNNAKNVYEKCRDMINNL